MKLSTRSRYAIMALVEMASTCPDGIVNLTTLALKQNLSLFYLEQIFSKMRKSNIVKSVRGTSGGYELSRHQNEIKIYDIIKAADGPIKMLKCSEKSSQDSCNGLQSKCNSHKLWCMFEQNLIGFLSAITLQDVVSGKLMQPQNPALSITL